MSSSPKPFPEHLSRAYRSAQIARETIKNALPAALLRAVPVIGPAVSSVLDEVHTQKTESALTEIKEKLDTLINMANAGIDLKPDRLSIADADYVRFHDFEETSNISLNIFGTPFPIVRAIPKLPEPEPDTDPTFVVETPYTKAFAGARSEDAPFRDLVHRLWFANTVEKIKTLLDECGGFISPTSVLICNCSDCLVLYPGIHRMFHFGHRSDGEMSFAVNTDRVHHDVTLKHLY